MRPEWSGPSWVTSISEVPPHRRVLPGGRQVRGKTRPVDQCAGQTARGTLRRQPTRWSIAVRVRYPGAGFHPLTVAVIADTALQADGWATVMAVLGSDKGLEIANARSLPVAFIEPADGGFVERGSAVMGRLLDQHQIA